MKSWETLEDCFDRISLYNNLQSTTKSGRILNSRIYKGYQHVLCSSSRPELFTDKLIERREEEKLYHDGSFSDKPVIAEGQNVWYRHLLRIFERKEPL